MNVRDAASFEPVRISQALKLALLPVRRSRASEPPTAGADYSLTFRAIRESEPGDSWREAFQSMWPAYRGWYLQEGEAARPDLNTCRSMLDTWMPELVPTFERMVALADGDPLAARFLSMYRPPAFVVGCSQAAFTGTGGPMLARNYDYAPARAEGIVYDTGWTGRRVIGMSDCLWGLLDGVNDAGLAVSLTFGGRPTVGDGFGIPLVIRYVLEVCPDVASACRVLSQIPVHAAQNVTLIDHTGDFATVRLSPDRRPEILTVPVAANHQHRDDWPAYAAAVDTFGREQRMLDLLRTPAMTQERLIEAFQEPPLYRTEFGSGLGTLYTAAYFPAEGRAEYRWPGHCVTQSFENFVPERHTQRYADAPVEAGTPTL